jgi:hypothetical protein
MSPRADGAENMIRVAISCIVDDTTIQCRAGEDMDTVEEYLEAMKAGAEFKPVDLFGSPDRAWIGDGWHRYMARVRGGFEDIEAILHPGERLDALRFALSANTTHGRRRTNADKRAAVGNALREWGHYTDRAIAEMCAVSHVLVGKARRELEGGNGNGFQCSTRTTVDGRQYPARRIPRSTGSKSREAVGTSESSVPVEPTSPSQEAIPPENEADSSEVAVQNRKQRQEDDSRQEAQALSADPPPKPAPSEIVDERRLIVEEHVATTTNEDSDPVARNAQDRVASAVAELRVAGAAVDWEGRTEEHVQALKNLVDLAVRARDAADELVALGLRRLELIARCIEHDQLGTEDEG